MNKIFNCCHGMFEPQQGHWMCSTKAAAGGRVDEEIIGDEGPVYSKSHLTNGDDASRGGGARPGGRGRGGPPVPVGQNPEDEKETAKQRLQRLIRDFAHDAVGPGLDVEVQSSSLAGTATDANATMEAKLRMDRKLSRLELWSVTGAQPADGGGEQCLLRLPLQQVKQIMKRNSAEPGDVTEADGAAGGARTEATSNVDSASSPDQASRQAKGSGDSPTPRTTAILAITRRPTASGSMPDLRLNFESIMVRDRAYTCLRIFQMSVDQSAEGQSREAESDATGYESSVTPTVP